MVYETAEMYLPTAELIQLNAELARIEGKAQEGRRFKRTTRRKGLSREQKLRAVAMYVKEGVPHSRIATHLGIGERHVRTLWREVREGRGSLSEPA
jgi:DNA invertase Pin-like site-specific DNA recombinase